MFKIFRSYWGLRIAQWYFSNGKRQKAIGILEQMIVANPTYHFGYLHLAKQLAVIGEFEKSLGYLLQGVELKKTNPVYQMTLGTVFYDMGDFVRAEEAFHSALKLDSSNNLTHNFIALCRLATGDLLGFQKILKEKGIFESSEVHIRLLLALERHRHTSRTRQKQENHELENQKLTE